MRTVARRDRFQACAGRGPLPGAAALVLRCLRFDEPVERADGAERGEREGHHASGHRDLDGQVVDGAGGVAGDEPGEGADTAGDQQEGSTVSER
jgi:hypothetical protein